MRTKNAKRLWPVPATLAVVALAAFLAFGLMATTGAQPAAAQDAADCTIPITGYGATTAIGDVNPDEDGDQMDLACRAFGDTATIKFVGPEGDPVANDPIDLYVLVEDKQGDVSFYPTDTVWQGEDDGERKRGAYYVSASGTDVAKVTKYSDHDVTVPVAVRQRGRFVSQSVSISVQGEGKVHVYLPSHYGMNGIVDDVTCDMCPDNVSPPAAERFNTNQPGGDSSTITITFLGKPSDSQKDTGIQYDHDGDGSGQSATDQRDPDGEDATDPSSKLATFTTDDPGVVPSALMSSAKAENDDGTLVDILEADELAAYLEGDHLWLQALTDEATTVIPSAPVDQMTERVYVLAEIRDNKGELLKGGSGVDSAVTFTAMYADGSDMKSSANVNYSRTEQVGTDGRASIELTGWTINSDASKVGPVRVTVTASYTGPSGTLDLGEVKLARVGAPETLMADSYICAELEKGDKKKADDGCPTDDQVANPPIDDTKPVKEMVFGQEGTIVVIAKLFDSLENEVKDRTIDINLSDDAEEVLDEQTDALGATALYMVEEDAELGQYIDGIVVSYGAGDDKLEQKLTFTVSGEAENYMLADPEMNIPLTVGSSQVFTVRATDENGNPPTDDPMVEIVVLGIDDAYVSGLDSDSMLDLEDGEGTFEIFTPVGAKDGDQAIILIRVDGVEQDRHTVTFGAATPVEGEMPTLMAPTNVAASSFGASKTVGVSWTPGSGAQQHIAVLFSSDGSIIVDVEYLGATADSHTFRDVASGDYLAVVASFRAGQMFMYDGIYPVTVQ